MRNPKLRTAAACLFALSSTNLVSTIALTAPAFELPTPPSLPNLPPLPGEGRDGKTATPIKHLVVIFGENISFDHYFGTYPNATNPKGEPFFLPHPGTPKINGFTKDLLTQNPNLNTANGVGATNPFRLDRTQAHTADQNHAYGPEQAAFDGGKMDLFPLYTGAAGTGGTGVFDTTGLVMGYYDGNTVTALWNYAQNFALNDNSYSTTFGPSTPGAINLIAGQTNGAVGYNTDGTLVTSPVRNLVDDSQGGFTLYGDLDPYLDVCSAGTKVEMKGRNIGDLLNARNITWGWFEGGFDLTKTNANGTTGCNRSTYSPIIGANGTDYIPHHQPFQYYASTRNPNHTRPSSVGVIGTSNDGGANHQYDIDDFYLAVKAHKMPAVSFLKAPAYQDAHPGYSDPLDEQTFVVDIINMLQKTEEWDSTAVVIAYDDSDGWYDHTHHVFNPSTSAQDYFLGSQQCGPIGSTLTAGVVPSNALNGINGKPVNGRCGFGPRQPLLIISPYAKENYVDHTLTDQSSVLRFIEDNWLNGEQIGQGSFDAKAGTIENMFDFSHKRIFRVFLDPNKGTRE